MRIRVASTGDAAELTRLTLELGYAASGEQIAARLARLLASPLHQVLVAEGVAGALLGWAVVERRLWLESGEKAELSGLVVDAKARRSGTGRALVAAAEAWGREQGLPALCVRSNIVRAESHPFYEALGYTRGKTQHVYQKALGD